MYVCWVWMRQMVYMSVQALYGAANAQYWNISERQNCVHLTLLRHQNTKTSLKKVSKNHWVLTIFLIFGFVRKKLQSTVSNDHPVADSYFQAEGKFYLNILQRSYLLFGRHRVAPD